MPLLSSVPSLALSLDDDAPTEPIGVILCPWCEAQTAVSLAGAELQECAVCSGPVAAPRPVADSRLVVKVPPQLSDGPASIHIRSISRSRSGVTADWK